MKLISLVTVVFCTVLASLVFLALRQEKIYEARTLILFALGWEYVYVPEPNQVGVKAPNPGDLQGFVNAEMLLLDNPRLIRRVIEKVSLERIYPDLPNTEEGMVAATVSLDNATRVELITGSYVVKVSVRHTDPVIAAEVTNALTDEFLELRRTLYADREVTAVTKRLQNAETEAIKIDSEISGIVGLPDITLIEKQLETAATDQARLASELRDSSLDLVGLKERQLALENVLGMDIERQQTQVSIKELQARIAYMNDEFATNASTIEDISAIMPRLRQLQESQSRQASRVAELELRLRDANAVAASGFDNVRVIEPGIPPLRSVSMPLRTRLAIAVVVSVVAALATLAISMIVTTGRIPGRATDTTGRLRRNGATLHALQQDAV